MNLKYDNLDKHKTITNYNLNDNETKESPNLENFTFTGRNNDHYKKPNYG